MILKIILQQNSFYHKIRLQNTFFNLSKLQTSRFLKFNLKIISVYLKLVWYLPKNSIFEPY